MMNSELSHREGSPKTPRIFVFDSPRTCSHLFRKLFLQHPQLGHILEPYLVASVFGHEGVFDDLQCVPAAKKVIIEARTAVPALTESTYAQANQALKEDLKSLEHEGRIPWIKDHALYSISPSIVLEILRSNVSTGDVLEKYSNPTMIDDDLLHSFTPIFLIRHPALVIQSYWEVNSQSVGADIEDEQFEWMISLKAVRIMFDLYRKHNGTNPLVVDARDVVHRTGELTGLICDHFGLDKTGVTSEWEPEPLSEAPGEFFKTRLRASKGVERDQDSISGEEVDIDTTFAKWSEKYGEDISNALKRRVEAELPDYQYLHQFKLLS